MAHTHFLVPLHLLSMRDGAALSCPPTIPYVLYPELRTWMAKNIQGHWFAFIKQHRYALSFREPKDAILFKLTWL